MPRTSLSATSESAFMVGRALGTRDRRIAFGCSCCSGGSSSSGRLAFFASARSAGAWPCGFWWSKGGQLTNGNIFDIISGHHLDSIQSTKPEIITSAGRSALEPRVSFSFAKIPTFLAPRTSLSATSESTFLVRGTLRTHRSRCRACHGFRRGCSEQVTPRRR